MNRFELISQIKKYKAFNEQEEKDKYLLLEWIMDNEDAFSRENKIAHITATGWSWVGGHADGETDLLAVAMREVKEETGIKKVCPVTEDIFSLESLTVDGHIKNGSYISSHLHLNITYLLEADSEETVSIKEDENSGVAWFAPEEALKKSSEPWFVAHIYKKLLDKMDETGRNVR